MLSNDKLNRINELARKAKTDSLTKKEKEEQASLRKEYIQNVRSSFTNQLKTMTVMDKEGNDVTPEKVKKLQKKNKKN
ncbi:DUF896 domain-containing protein [Virgibacillus sp. W0181]|uniref:DUF896 domain-containing protein n=1 Tax=Virgibacillus sp. W0181 TaxID=3391581 RepID=UPI003F48C6E4